MTTMRLQPTLSGRLSGRRTGWAAGDTSGHRSGPAAHLSPEDVEALGREIAQVRQDVLDSRGARDAAYIRRVIAAQRALELSGRAVLVLASKRRGGWALGTLMLGFYLTCIVFIAVVLGAVLWFVSRVNIFLLMKYLAREYLLIVSTSSSEAALPRLIAKLEHLGVSRPVVGITVPTGYSFNLDGTAIYLTMASLFIASAMGTPLSVPEQIGMLVFMIVASKGAAGVTGAGLATLAGGLQTYRPDLVDGVGIIVGIDRFMSEARALTNFTGNAVATVVIGTWTREIDRGRVTEVLTGALPFDETTMNDPHGDPDEDAGFDARVNGSRERVVEPSAV